MAKKKKSSGPGPIKELITTMLEPDENGKLKNMTMFAIMNVFIVPIILYEGIKIGLYPEKGAGSIIGGFTHNIITILEMRKNYGNIQGVGFQPGGLVLLLCIWGFFFVYNFVRIDRDKRKSSNSKGNAHWNTLRKYNPVFVYPKGAAEPQMNVPDDCDEPGNMILGRMSASQPICFDMHQKGGTNVYCNTLIVGSTGTGKSFGFVKPNVMQFNCSYVITDPAGDLTRECGPGLVHEGYNVKVFNVAEMKYSCRYNPFRYVRSEQDIMTMINVFMQNTDDSESGKGDQFFTKAEQCLYLAMAFYIYTVYKDQPEKQTFNTMFDMYQMANASEDSKRENEVNEFDKLFIELAKVDPLNPALKFYRIFKKGTGKTLKSILISAGVRLSFLAIPDVANLLSGDDLELETLGDRKSAIFMIIKAEDATYNFITAMLFTQMFETQYYVAGQLNPNALLLTKGTCTALKSEKFVTPKQEQDAREKLEKERQMYMAAKYEEDNPNDPKFTTEYDEDGFLPYPKCRLVYEDPDTKEKRVLKEFLGKKECDMFMDCIKNGTIKRGKKHLTSHLRFILDEFANIGKIPDFDKKIATFRKYWISSDIIIQSLDQLRKMYEDNIGLIIGNCNIIICLGTTDKEDSEFFSELLGQKTVDVVSHNFDNKGIFVGTTGGNYSADAENLMRPEDVRSMKPDECLIIINTQQPFKAKKYPATAHPNYKLLYDDHKSPDSDEYVPPFEYQRIFKVTPMEQKGVTAEELLGTAPAQQSQGKKTERLHIGPAKKSVPADGYSAVAENKHFNKPKKESKVRDISVAEMMGVTPDENGNVKMKDIAEKNPGAAEKMNADLLNMYKKTEIKVDENNQVSFLGSGINGNPPIISDEYDGMF